MLALLAALAIVWVLWQPQTTVRDDALPALAVVLAALGLAMVARLSPPLAQRQQLWVLFSLVALHCGGARVHTLSTFRRI